MLFIIQTNIKDYNVGTPVFHYVAVATWEVLVFDRFLKSAFVISPRKKAPTSHFYSSQHVENRGEKNYVIRVYSNRNHILTF